MPQKNNTLNRKHGKHLRVPVLPIEENTIKDHARQSGLTIAEFLRRVGLGCEIKSMIDKNHILSLAKINADLGRLGGLLKLWLVDDKRIKALDQQKILTLLNQIKINQAMMFDAVKKL